MARMKIRRLVLAGAAISVIAACSTIREFHDTHPDFGSTLPPYERIQFAAQFATDAERVHCEAAGGTMERAGRAGWEHCVQTYPDAGKSCHDGDDCLGDCRAPEGIETPGPDTPMEGVCQAQDISFGCYTTVEGGKVARSICVD